MSVKESFEKAIMDGRTLAVIVIVAILWRTYISLNDTIPPITFWESLCSGIALIIFGWVLFAYTYHMFKIQKGWPISNWIYQGIAISMVSINIYVLIYYGMRWLRLLHVEAYLPLDFLFRDIRFIALVVFYCAILWSVKYVNKMHEDYIAESKGKAFLHLISPYLYPTVKKLREMNVRELIGTVITDERTLLVVVGIAFLWRTAISFDYMITKGESICSGIAIFILGWLLFTHLVIISMKQRDWLDLAKAYRGIILGVIAINIYVLVYYMMRWYRLSGDVVEAFVPLDYIFRDVRFFALVIFYCAAIVLSKFLKRAYDEYRILSASEEAKTSQ
ncbi:MAG: hypothetical protein KAU16_02770 [Methanophagales archaeon]|nr:hypothetical protein [Methanophagales archaeon]